MPTIPHIMDYTGNGWVGAVAMFLMLGFYLALGISGSHYVKKFKEMDAPRRRAINYREEQQDAKSAIVMTLATVCGIALFAYILMMRLQVVQQGLLSVAIVLGAVAVYVALKYLFILLVNHIFRFNLEKFWIWLQLIFFSAGLCSVILALVASYLPYLTTVLIASGVVLVVLLIAEFLVLVKNFSANFTSFFYIFLYLCTSEILPLAVGVRVISNVLN